MAMTPAQYRAYMAQKMTQQEPGLVPAENLVSDTAAGYLSKLGASPTLADLGGMGADVVTGLLTGSLASKGLKYLTGKAVPVAKEAIQTAMTPPELVAPNLNMMSLHDLAHVSKLQAIDDEVAIAKARARILAKQKADIMAARKAAVANRHDWEGEYTPPTDAEQIAAARSRIQGKNIQDQLQAAEPYSEGEVYNPMDQFMPQIEARKLANEQATRTAPPVTTQEVDPYLPVPQPTTWEPPVDSVPLLETRLRMIEQNASESIPTESANLNFLPQESRPMYATPMWKNYLENISPQLQEQLKAQQTSNDAFAHERMYKQFDQYLTKAAQRKATLEGIINNLNNQ